MFIERLGSVCRYVVARDDETWSVWSSFKNQGHKVIAGKTQSSVIIKKKWAITNQVWAESRIFFSIRLRLKIL